MNNGILSPIILSTNASYLDLCEYIQNELGKNGLEIEINVNPPSTHRQMVATSKLSFFRASWIADYPDAENYLSLFYSKNHSPNGPNYTHFNNKSFDVKKLKAMSDNDAINYITQLKGLGIWSAQMFLMFNLNRSDMYPTGDIGLLRALSLNYKTSYPPSKKFLDKISNLHSGYRTVLTWYMWRSIDPVDVEY